MSGQYDSLSLLVTIGDALVGQLGDAPNDWLKILNSANVLLNCVEGKVFGRSDKMHYSCNMSQLD